MKRKLTTVLGVVTCIAGLAVGSAEAGEESPCQNAYLSWCHNICPGPIQWKVEICREQMPHCVVFNAACTADLFCDKIYNEPFKFECWYSAP
jgi:hypothetical protein